MEVDLKKVGDCVRPMMLVPYIGYRLSHDEIGMFLTRGNFGRFICVTAGGSIIVNEKCPLSEVLMFCAGALQRLAQHDQKLMPSALLVFAAAVAVGELSNRSRVWPVPTFEAKLDAMSAWESLAELCERETR